MSLHDERPYKPKIRGRRVYVRDELSFGTLRHRVQHALRARVGRTARARVATKSLGHLGRRVIVKAWYVRGSKDAHRSAKTFLRNMEKEGAARDGGHSVLYGVGSTSAGPREPDVSREVDQEASTRPSRTTADSPADGPTGIPGDDLLAGGGQAESNKQQVARSASELERDDCADARSATCRTVHQQTSRTISVLVPLLSRSAQRIPT